MLTKRVTPRSLHPSRGLPRSVASSPRWNGRVDTTYERHVCFATITLGTLSHCHNEPPSQEAEDVGGILTHLLEIFSHYSISRGCSLRETQIVCP
jgi:hypothetical protein